MAHPASRFALETVKNLFDETLGPVRERLTPELSAELGDGKLSAIVRGLVQAHGPPAQVVDAWPSEITEKDERMPAAHVLVRMANGVRVDLTLVFDPVGAVRGLWLRPM